MAFAMVRALTRVLLQPFSAAVAGVAGEAGSGTNCEEFDWLVSTQERDRLQPSDQARLQKRVRRRKCSKA